MDYHVLKGEQNLGAAWGDSKIWSRIFRRAVKIGILNATRVFPSRENLVSAYTTVLYSVVVQTFPVSPGGNSLSDFQFNIAVQTFPVSPGGNSLSGLQYNIIVRTPPLFFKGGLKIFDFDQKGALGQENLRRGYKTE